MSAYASISIRVPQPYALEQIQTLRLASRTLPYVSTTSHQRQHIHIRDKWSQKSAGMHTHRLTSAFSRTQGGTIAYSEALPAPSHSLRRHAQLAEATNCSTRGASIGLFRSPLHPNTLRPLTVVVVVDVAHVDCAAAAHYRAADALQRATGSIAVI